MTRVGFGAANQVDKTQQGGKFGTLPAGTHQVTVRWEIKLWDSSQFGKEGQRRNLRLRVSTQDIVETLSTGTAPEWLAVTEGGRCLESPPGQVFQISKNTPGAFFTRSLEEVAGQELESDWGAHDGMRITLKRFAWPTGKPETVPQITAIENFRSGTAKTDFKTFGSETPSAMDDPTGHRAWAKATILALMNGKVKQALAELEPDEIAKHLPAAVTTGDDQLAVVKLVMSPAYLKTQDGWLYDEYKHTVVVL